MTPQTPSPHHLPGTVWGCGDTAAYPRHPPPSLCGLPTYSQWTWTQERLGKFRKSLWKVEGAISDGYDGGMYISRRVLGLFCRPRIYTLKSNLQHLRTCPKPRTRSPHGGAPFMQWAEVPFGGSLPSSVMGRLVADGGSQAAAHAQSQEHVLPARSRMPWAGPPKGRH